MSTHYCPECNRPQGYCHPNCPNGSDPQPPPWDIDDREEFEKDQLVGEE